MRTELKDWKNGWYGVQLALSTGEIDELIERLQVVLTPGLPTRRQAPPFVGRPLRLPWLPRGNRSGRPTNGSNPPFITIRLQMLKTEPDQHFHLSSTYQDSGGLGDITVYLQDAGEPSNMDSIGSKALAPGDTSPAPILNPRADRESKSP